MAEEHFTITYDGVDVEGARMSVRELAPALLALADTIREAQRESDPYTAEPALDIRALREGSFVVDLIVSEASILEHARDLLTGRDATATVNLVQLLAVLFGAYKLCGKLYRKIRRQDDLPDGMVRITFDDDTTIIVPRESVTLASSLAFREAARVVVQPVNRPGIDFVELSVPATTESHESTAPVRVTKSDLAGFDLPPASEEPIADSEREVALRPLNVAFIEGNKWRVSDGDSVYFASIHDRSFLDDVAAGREVFSKSDILRARVRTRQYRTADGDLRVEHDIIQVLDHILGARQVPLPFEEDDSDTEPDAKQ